MKAKAMKPVKAWCVTYEGDIRPVGQEDRWQYPVFFLRREARDYAREPHGGGSAVRRVLITPLPGRKEGQS